MSQLGAADKHWGNFVGVNITVNEVLICLIVLEKEAVALNLPSCILRERNVSWEWELLK